MANRVVTERVLDLIFTAEAVETLGIEHTVSILIEDENYSDVTAAPVRILR